MLKKTIFSLVIFTCLIFSRSYSQNEGNIWYFGDHAGLDFNSGSAVAITNGASYSLDCSATISDNTGALLFYSNGDTVWNKNHAVMQNGTGLMGSNNAGQCVVIVPKPYLTVPNNIYYLFTVDQFDGVNGFRYHTIDMSLNAGLGSVTSANNLLFSPSTEKIDVVHDCANNQYWVVTHEWNSNQFNAYKITTAGLNTTPVTSSVGTIHTGGMAGNYNSMGQLTISPQGNKLVCAVYTTGIYELFDFDPITGIVSNPKTITGYTNAWGTAFSPDGSKLYTTTWFGTDIIQFNVNAGNASAIMASSTIAGTVTGPGTFSYYAGYLQLGPDGKIYCAVFDDTYLAVINNPNNSGTACNFVDNGMYLGGKKSVAGICRTVPHCMPAGLEDNAELKNISVYPNPSNSNVQVQIPANINSVKSTIYDVAGVVHQNEENKITDRFLNLDIHSLADGIYFIKIESNDGFYYAKFIKN